MVAPERRHRCSAMGPALADLGISIPVRANLCRDGAKCFGMYSSADTRDFVLTQGASAPANQNSVLVIHVFLLSSFWCMQRVRDLPGRGLAARLELAFRRTISVAAEFRVPGAGRKGPQTSADLLSLFPVQFTSALPNQDSAFVIHACSPFSSILGPLSGPKLFRKNLAWLPAGKSQRSGRIY